MKIDSEKLSIVDVTADNASDWSKVFLKSMTSFRWMNRYIKSLNISELDVKISLEQDLVKNKDELFVMAYYDNLPVGIIRASEYWLAEAHLIPSHYPLILPRFQRKGIGEILVKEIIKRTKLKSDKEIWTETWTKDKRELHIYELFYEKIGFNLISNRSEMSCLLANYKNNDAIKTPDVKITIENNLTNEFVIALSDSYSDSIDELHKIEKIGNKKICSKYIKKLSQTFQKMGYNLQYHIVTFSEKPCAALLTATSSSKGIIMEIGVIPEYRKKNIGKMLLSRYLTDLKKEKVPEVVLAVDLNNNPAINLYLKLGFKHNWFGKMFLLKLNKNKKQKLR
ncbi:MAG: GNAT family N-acetyltransferase [Asgard group archaeon]|nr:GNAT family N-acetyltransferase [Asgard group archaeon]